MRSLWSLWLPALAAVAKAASSSGQIFFYERYAEPSQHQHTVDAKTAGLILASRLGVSQYHELGAASDDAISTINDFGYQKIIVDPRVVLSGFRPGTALLLTTSEDGLDQSYSRRLKIAAMPTLERTRALFDAFATQQDGTDFTREDVPKLLADGSTGKDKISGKALDSSELNTAIGDLYSRGYDVLVVVNPTTSASSASYGGWVLPPSLHKRQSETPLEDLESFTLQNETTFSTLQDDDGNGDNSSPLPGILPACYSTKSACESTTRNCTGHGTCALAYTQRDTTGDSQGVDCFQCMCTPTVRTNADGGKKTTVWSGPACQKKDISVQFWLLAGFSVFMAFLVSWGVGTLWSMGDEELPSVIGAGVSGPTRK